MLLLNVLFIGLVGSLEIPSPYYGLFAVQGKLIFISNSINTGTKIRTLFFWTLGLKCALHSC